MMKIASGQLSCKFRVYENVSIKRADSPEIHQGYSRNSHSPGSLAGPCNHRGNKCVAVRRIRVKTLTSRLSSARSKAHNSFSPSPDIGTEGP